MHASRLTENPVVQEDLVRIAASDIDWEAFRDKSVLISGATGLIGGQLLLGLVLGTCHRHLHTQFAVVCRNQAKFQSQYATLLRYVEAHAISLRIIESDLSANFPNTAPHDFVFHCASLCTPSAYGTDPIGVLLPNTVGTALLLQRCRPKTGAFVFLSSAEVCGAITDNPIREDSYGPLDPTALRACYAEGKRAGEAMCTAWSHQTGTQTRILRLFHTYGPGMPLGDGRVFSDFVHNALNNQAITIQSDGLATRSYCYVTDAVIGILIALFKGEPAQPYNLGNADGELSVGELAELISALSHQKGVIYRQQPTHTGYLRSSLQRSRPDVSRIHALGWQATTSPTEGFQRTLRSFQKD